MGYCTDFTLTVVEVDETTVLAITGWLSANVPLHPWSGGRYFYDASAWGLPDTNWHGYRSHMIKLSKAFPKVVFTLYGEGEEPEDLWYEYWSNGLVQEAPVRFEYDAYDPGLLTTP